MGDTQSLEGTQLNHTQISGSQELGEIVFTVLSCAILEVTCYTAIVVITNTVFDKIPGNHLFNLWYTNSLIKFLLQKLNIKHHPIYKHFYSYYLY